MVKGVLRTSLAFSHVFNRNTCDERVAVAVRRGQVATGMKFISAMQELLAVSRRRA